MTPARDPKQLLEAPKSYQETPRGHPGATQEAPRRHPRATQRHPRPQRDPRASRRHPEGTQEPARRHPGDTQDPPRGTQGPREAQEIPGDTQRAPMPRPRKPACTDQYTLDVRQQSHIHTEIPWKDRAGKSFREGIPGIVKLAMIHTAQY